MPPAAFAVATPGELGPLESSAAVGWQAPAAAAATAPGLLAAGPAPAGARRLWAVAVQAGSPSARCPGSASSSLRCAVFAGRGGAKAPWYTVFYTCMLLQSHVAWRSHASDALQKPAQPAACAFDPGALALATRALALATRARSRALALACDTGPCVLATRAPAQRAVITAQSYHRRRAQEWHIPSPPHTRGLGPRRDPVQGTRAVSS